MNALIATLEILTTLARYSQWRDGCPDCGREDRVQDRGDGLLVCAAVMGPYYHAYTCGRQWKRGEA